MGMQVQGSTGLLSSLGENNKLDEYFKRISGRYLCPNRIKFWQLQLETSFAMGACQCGYSTDPEKNCNGTHKVVQAVKADIAEKLAANGFPHASEYVKNN